MRKKGRVAWVGCVVGAICAAAIAASVAATAAASSSADEPAGLTDARASDCFSCHAIDHKVVGPAYDEVAKRYAGQGSAVVGKLVKKVIKGGSGNWGTIPMTPHPNLAPAKVRTIVEWILALKPAGGGSATPAQSAKTYSYTLADGKTVRLDFPVFLSGSHDKKVTDALFTGYEQYNSYCFRCHGNDAVGGEYAPDLRNSLANGMTYQQFLATSMAGRQGKGMPAWAGFFTPEQIRDIYEYVKARQVGLVPQGRPPSAQD